MTIKIGKNIIAGQTAGLASVDDPGIVKPDNITIQVDEEGIISANLPKNISELTNDIGYLTEHQDISNKADKSTTIAGYNIQDAYTKLEIDNKFTQFTPDLSNYYTKEQIAQELTQASTASAQTIKNQNNGQDVKIWLGNKAEYKAITHSNDTIYHITDENVIGGGGAGVSSVVEVYGNSASGYRLWSDGYCEQWGNVSTSTSNPARVTLLKAYKDAKYSVSITSTGAYIDSNYLEANDCIIGTMASSNFLVYTAPWALAMATTVSGTTVYWKTSGYVS